MTDKPPSLRSQRASVMLSAHIFQLGRAEPTQHRIKNISETGVCLACSDDLTVGSVVVMSIGQVDHVAADVKWVRGTLAGLAFHAPINLAHARLRRAGNAAMPAIASGWLAELNDIYRG